MFNIEPLLKTGVNPHFAVVVVLLLPFLPLARRWLKSRIKHNLSSSIASGGELHALLGELRVAAGADRVGVFQFHNGGVFSSKHPIFRVACTGEACGPGVRPAGLEPVMASRITPLIAHLFGEAPTGAHVAPKGTTYSMAVDQMELGYSRAALESQGVNQTIQRPLRDKRGLVVGYVAVDYCDFGRATNVTPHNAIPTTELIEDYSRRIERLCTRT